MEANKEFGRQIDALVAENQHLRVKSENDDITINLMREQYRAMAESVESMRNKYERQIFQLTTERDDAVAKRSKIKSLLLQGADITMQALRADAGDDTPEKMPAQTGTHISDDRLPIARLG